jgi:hypothetical protein
MPEDERTKLRRECQEDLDALRGVLDERQWVLFERIIARLTRIELGTFSASEENTKPGRRFTSTEQEPRAPTPAYPMPATQEPVGRVALKSAQRRYDSTERWTAEGVREIFEEAKKDPPKEGGGE